MTTLFNHRGRAARAAALCLLALAAALFGAREARAQWTTSGTTTTTTNTVGVGTAAPQTSLHVSTATTGVRGIVNEQTSNDANSALFYFRKSRAGAAAQNGDNVGSLFASAFDGASFVSGSRLRFAIDGPVAAGSVPTAIQFLTGANADGVERMRITSGGNVGIGTAEPTDRLEINGAVANGAGLTITTAGSAKYRIGTVGTTVPNWGGQLMNARYNQAVGNWTLDDNTLPAAFMKLDLRNHTYGNEIGFYRIPAGGSNPRADTSWTPLAQFKLDTGNVLLTPSSGNVGIGTTNPNYNLVVGPSLPSGFVYASMTVSRGPNASSSIVVGESGSSLAEVGWDNPNRRAYLNAAGSTPIALTQNGTNVRMYVTGSGDIGMGTTTPASKLHVAGNITVDGNINAKYQDVAEWVPSTQKLAAGTVVILDAERDNHVLASKGSYDTRVAGVISAQPGLSLGEAGEGKVLVATTGRVKVRVDATRAPVKIGDLIVTSEVEGVAMKSEPVSVGGVAMHRPGTLIGKALESLAKGTGEILVLLSLQ